MDIKEIALKVAEERFPQLPEGVLDFAEALVAEIQRRGEPVAEIRDVAANKSVHEIRMAHFTKGCLPPVGTKLFTFPPDKAQIEQSVAEAWQPIETAPKDGIVVLVSLHDSNIPQPARFAEELWKHAWDNYEFSEWDGPTHWMPLPNPPATGASS